MERPRSGRQESRRRPRVLLEPTSLGQMGLAGDRAAGHATSKQERARGQAERFCRCARSGLIIYTLLTHGLVTVWLKKTRQQQSENVLVASLQNAIDLVSSCLEVPLCDQDGCSFCYASASGARHTAHLGPASGRTEVSRDIRGARTRRESHPPGIPQVAQPRSQTNARSQLD